MGLKKRVFNFFFLVGLIISSTVAFAQNGDPASASLHWQKLTLEEKIENKISELLKVSIPDQQILVKVLVQAKAKTIDPKQVQRQKFLAALSKSQDQNSKYDNDFILRKLDITKEDFFRLEAPLEEKQVVIPDLLEGIKEIDVILFFPKETAKTVRKEIVTLVSQVFEKKFNRNLNIIAANNPYANHAKLEKDKIPPTFEEKWKNFFIPFVVFLSVGIFGIIFLFMIGRLKQFSLEVSNALRDVGQNIIQSQKPEVEELGEAVNANALSEDIQVAAEASNLQQISFQKFLGVNRFKKLLKNDFQNALLLLGRLISSEKQTESFMVHLIFKSLDDSDVMLLTNKMSHSQLQKVQNFMNVPLKEREIGIFDKYIELAVMGLLLDSKPKLPYVVGNYISTLTAQSAYKLAQESTIIGGMLLHYLPQNILKDLVPLLDEHTLSECLKHSNEFDHTYLMKHGAEIEGLINQKTINVENEKISGLLTILPSFLDSADKTKEAFILKEMRDFCTREEFVSVIYETMPTSFLIDISEDFARRVFEGISIKTKAKMVATMPDHITWSLPEWVGAENSKSRDIFELEISDLKNDPKLMEQAKSNADKMWKEFFQKIRTVIKLNNEIQPAIRETLEQWVDSTFTYTEERPSDSADAA